MTSEDTCDLPMIPTLGEASCHVSDSTVLKSQC